MSDEEHTRGSTPGRPPERAGSDPDCGATGTSADPDSAFGWLRRSARLWGFFSFVVLVLVLFHEVLLPFVLALLVAYILAPLVRHLGRARVRGHQVPRFVWIILVYAALLGLLGLFVTNFVPRLSNDVKRVIAETPALFQKARTQWVPRVASWMQHNFGTDVKHEGAASGDDPTGGRPGALRVVPREGGGLELDVSKLELELEQATDNRWVIRQAGPQKGTLEGSERFTDAINHRIAELVSKSESAVNQLFRLGQQFVLGIFKTITTFILVLMVSAFLLADTDRILFWLRNLMPARYTEDFDNLVVLVDKGLSGAIRGQFIICIINGILTWLGLHLIGVKYPLLLGLLAAIMSLIPIFGSIISSIPIVVVAMVSGESGVEIWRALLILLWIIGIHLLEANLLNPKIMGTAAKIHPVLVIFAVVAGERTYGAVGALLGVPIFSAMQAIFIYVRDKVRQGEWNMGGPTEPGEGGAGEPPAAGS